MLETMSVQRDREMEAHNNEMVEEEPHDIDCIIKEITLPDDRELRQFHEEDMEVASESDAIQQRLATPRQHRCMPNGRDVARRLICC